MPNRRSDKTSPLAAAIRRDVPTNMRLFAEYMLGDNSEITEKAFRPEELQVMRSQILRAMEENDKQEQAFRDYDTSKFNMKSNEWEPVDYSDQINSYDKTRGKTAIDYYDYEQDFLPEREQSLKRSFTDPEYNVQTTLGQYIAHDEDGKSVIRDNYDWGDRKSVPIPEDASNTDFIKMLLLSDNLREAGDILATKFRNEVGGRPVKVNLGKLEDKIARLTKKASEEDDDE